MSAFDCWERKKEECEFVDSLYTNNINLHMRRRRGYKKTKLVRTGSVLFWEQRADIELRGVGVSCRVVLFWELVRVAKLARRSSNPLFFITSYFSTKKSCNQGYWGWARMLYHLLVEKVKLVAKLQKVQDLASFIPLSLHGDALALYLEMSNEDQVRAEQIEMRLEKRSDYWCAIP